MALDVRTKSPAPYQTLVLPQDTQEEEVVSLASGFDNEVDPFAIEQPVAPVELDFSLYGGQARPFVDTVAMNERLAAEDPAAIMARINASLGYDLGSTDTTIANLDPANITAYAMDVQRPQLLQDINLSRDSFTDEEFTDNTKFWDIYTPKEAEFKQGQRDALTDLYSTDIEQFSKVYDNLDINSQLNFVEGQYSQGTIDKTTYLEQAAGLLYADDARRSAPNAEPSKQYFIKEDTLYEVPSTFADDPSGFYAREVILFDDQELSGTSRDSRLNEEQLFKRAIGQTNYESADSESTWVAARDNVLKPMARIGLAMATGGSSEQLVSAIKLASGETLHGSDYANLAMGGLEMANVITPPVNAAQAAQAGTDAMNAANAAGLTNAIEIGNAAQTAATTGSGLLGLSYGRTSQLLGAIGNQDPLNAALALTGDGLITDTLEAIGIPTELANDPDFIEGTTAALETAVAGGNLQDALQDGLVEYITEGGGFGGVPNLDFDGLASVLDPIVGAVETVGDALAPIFDSVEDIAQVVGDVAEDVVIDPADDIIDLLGSEVVDPILQAVEPVVNVIEDVVIDPIDDALDYVGSEVVDPVLQATEDVAQEVGDVIEDYVIDPVDDVLDFVGEEYVDPALQTIGDAIPDVDLPDIDLPDVDLPDISLPNLGLPSVGLPQVVMPSSPSATRTTDTLFGDMLKLETKITPFQQALIQSQQQQQQMASLPATQQLVNYNRLGQFLQPTQPAEGLITGRRF